MLSETPRHLSKTNSVSVEQNVALWKLINRSRMLNGWTTKTAEELDDTIETWGEMFNHYQIPTTAYPELYLRGFDVRQRKMNLGQEPPQMDATLLVSQWTGENGLQKELREKAKIGIDRQLEMGGEPCPDDIAEKLKKFGLKI